ETAIPVKDRGSLLRRSIKPGFPGRVDDSGPAGCRLGSTDPAYQNSRQVAASIRRTKPRQPRGRLASENRVGVSPARSVMEARLLTHHLPSGVWVPAHASRTCM